MSVITRAIFILLCFAISGSTTATAARRVALVIGNSAYKIGPLANPGNDADAVAKMLVRLGFDRVIHKRDLGFEGFREALGEIGREAANADQAVVFFAGHGTQSEGRNYLIPVDAKLDRASDLDLQAVALSTVLNQLAGAPALKLVILDACRNSLFALSDGRRALAPGLARIDPEDNTVVAYATKAGSVAVDGDGLHSPFTAALLKHIGTPGIDVTFVFRRVRDDVRQATAGRQAPDHYTSLGGSNVSLNPVPPGHPSFQPEMLPARDLPQARAGLGNIVGVREPGYSARHGSAWLDLSPALSFYKGDRLRLTLGSAAAKHVRVRLLQDGNNYDSPANVIDEKFAVPASRVVEVMLKADYPRTIQISVHGNPNPWGKYPLGADNGPATLVAVERVPQFAR